MKMNRKLVLLISFCLGATIFAVSVFADITSNTGYDQLKDAFKNTGEILSNDVESFTMNWEYLVKSNGQIISRESKVSKYDLINKKSVEEGIEESVNNVKDQRYFYSDAKKSIRQYNGGIYYVTQNSAEIVNHKVFNNPFKEEGIKDVERIFDAFVVGLRDHVMVEEDADGSKYFEGAVSDSQIPTLINAVSSYAFKRIIVEEVTYRDFPMPILEDDIYVKKVNGRASTNSEGIMESLFATFVVGGKDKDGNTHDFTLEFVMKVFDINSTDVIEPDLTDKDVELSYEGAYGIIEITDKYLGKWKSDVVVVVDGKFQKIGERFVEIASIDSKNVYGRYYSIYNEEYLDYSRNYEFIVDIDHSRGGRVRGTEPSENEGNIYFDGASIDFYFNKGNLIEEPGSLNYSRYQKVFED